MKSEEACVYIMPPLYVKEKERKDDVMTNDV